MANERADGRRPTALVADLDEVERTVLVTHLRAEGYDVAASESVQEVLRRASEEAFDLAVCEVDTPGVDGQDLRNRLERGAGREVPVIFVTSKPDKPRDRAVLRDAPLLVKPVPRAHLRAAIDYVRSRQSQRLHRSERGISGDLTDFTVPDLCRFIEEFTLSGVARFKRDGQVASVTFSAGQPADAEVGALRGEDAFFELIEWTEGGFEFEIRDSRVERTIHRRSSQLLIEGLRLNREWLNLRKRLPEPLDQYAIERGDALLCCPDEASRQLLLAGAQGRVVSLADVLATGAFDRPAALARLVQGVESGTTGLLGPDGDAVELADVPIDADEAPSEPVGSLEPEVEFADSVDAHGASDVALAADQAQASWSGEVELAQEVDERGPGMRGGQRSGVIVEGTELVWDPPEAELVDDEDTPLPVTSEPDDRADSSVSGAVERDDGPIELPEHIWQIEGHDPAGDWDFPPSAEPSRRGWGLRYLLVAGGIALVAAAVYPLVRAVFDDPGSEPAEAVSTGSGEGAVPAPMSGRQPRTSADERSRSELVFDAADSERRVPRVSRAIALMRIGEIDAAEDVLRRALELDPGNRAAKRTLIALEFDRGRWEDAKRGLLELAHAHLASPEDLLSLAVVYDRAGERQEAETYFTKFLDSVPVHHPYAKEVRSIVGQR
jgi:CheY-like chemotaxis protein